MFSPILRLCVISDDWINEKKNRKKVHSMINWFKIKEIENLIM